MQEIFEEDKAYKLNVINDIEIYMIQTEKFKTNTINLFFHDNLTEESVAYNSLLPAVMRRGCIKMPSQKDIALKLESLYGATFDCGVVKKGEYQLIQFYADYVREKFVNSKQSLFKETLDLLYSIIAEPLVNEQGFNLEYTEQEKQNLCKLIESRINDKTQYAVDRCLELLCKDQPYSIYEYGEVNLVKAINPQRLYEYYKKLVEFCPATLFLCGKYNDEEISLVTEELKKFKRNKIKALNKISIAKSGKVINEIKETMNIGQGKLSLGFTTSVSPADKDYYPLIFLNGIFGGGVHSKLFQNVREKAGLAYYAFSRLDRFKGILVASSGIDVQNKDQALEIILDQMNNIKNGNISDYEFQSTSKSIKTSLETFRDNQMSLVDFYLSQMITGTNDSLDEMVQKIEKVTKKQVIEVSQLIKFELEYFLQGQKIEMEESIYEL